MIRDAHDANEATKPNDFELERLRAALPEYFDKDGEFRLDRLQEALSSADVSMTREGYELKFLGKSYAKYLTSTRTETVIVPDLEHNAEAANAESENLYIVGDNLDALKHLLGSYAGQVKCIYIDPPYNTGSDGFVYSDDFGFTSKDLVEKVGLDEDEAGRVMTLQGKSSHSAWLTFMYPRLELARELLADDGVIFISIDDNEQANLRALCDEIFGEQNFVSELIRLTNPKGRSQDMYVANNHEYLLAYSAEPLVKGAVSVSKTEDDVAKGYRLFDPERGPYRELELRNTHREFGRHNRPNLFYPLYASDSGEVSLEWTADHHIEIFPLWPDGFEGCWTWNSAAAARNIDLLVAREVKAQWKVYRKSYARAGAQVVTKQVKSLWTESDMRTEYGQQEVDSLFDSREKVFSAPKPTPLVKRVIKMAADTDSIVLDFFSGSGTTADAVMQLNAEDGGKRRYIMVQIPEAIDSQNAAHAMGFHTIDQIGRGRIVRAANKIRASSGADIDYGFKVYHLERPSLRTLDELQSFEPNENDVLFSGDFVSKFAFNETPGDRVALSTWLLQDGFGLTPEVNDVGLDDYTLKVCEDSGYVIEPGLGSDEVMALVAKLEAGELDLKRLVVFGYSVPFSVMHELRQNLKSLRSGQSVSVIERY